MLTPGIYGRDGVRGGRRDRGSRLERQTTTSGTRNRHLFYFLFTFSPLSFHAFHTTDQFLAFRPPFYKNHSRNTERNVIYATTSLFWISRFASELSFNSCLSCFCTAFAGSSALSRHSRLPFLPLAIMGIFSCRTGFNCFFPLASSLRYAPLVSTSSHIFPHLSLTDFGNVRGIESNRTELLLRFVMEDTLSTNKSSYPFLQ